MTTMMTTTKMLFLALTVLLSGQALAGEQFTSTDKKVKKIVRMNEQMIRISFDSLVLSEIDLAELTAHFEETKFHAISMAEKELDFNLSDEVLEVLGMHEDISARRMESWMFDELIATDEEMPLEDWMFTELNPSEEEMKIESWMLDTEYFNK